MIEIPSPDSSGGGGTVTDPYVHPSDSQIINGTIDLDALLSEIEDGQSFHFQTTGQSVFNSTTPLNTFINGVSETGLIAVNVESGIQGYLTKNSSGTITVHYYTLEIDPHAINEYIHNIYNYELNIAHEGTGSPTIGVGHNGSNAAFENIENGTDNGDGSISFSGGTNQVYNKRANTTVGLKNVDDVFTVTIPSIGQYDTVWIAITESKIHDAESLDNIGFHLRFTATAYFIYDKENNQVATGSGEVGTYTITRTYYGIKVEKNGVFIWESPEVIKNYKAENTTLSGSESGLFRIGVHKPSARINTLATGTEINTGFDFTQHSDMRLKVTFGDNGSGIQWQTGEIDVDELVSNFDNEASLDSYIQIYDNDWVRVNLVDKTQGIIKFQDQGRDMAYIKSELWSVAARKTPDYQIGNIWHSAYPPTESNKLQVGDIFNWSDHPKLQEKNNNNPSAYITNNGDGTATVNSFLRAEHPYSGLYGDS